jgi:hypothetical protein
VKRKNVQISFAKALMKSKENKTKRFGVLETS